MPLKRGTSQKTVSANIRAEVKAGQTGQAGGRDRHEPEAREPTQGQTLKGVSRMDPGKTIRVLRHGSEVEIPEAEFNAVTDTRLDGKPAAGEPGSQPSTARADRDATGATSDKTSDKPKR